MPLNANDRSAQSNENLDVAGTSQNRERLERKEPAGELAVAPHLSVVCPFPPRCSQPRKARGRYRPLGSRDISLAQATNIVEAVKFAKSIGLPLVAHLTIHWAGTDAWDDPEGTRFAKVREGLAKVLFRRGIPAAWVWCRECKAHTDIVHSHLLFHLPAEYRVGQKLAEIEAHLERLVALHGGGIWSECVVKLKIWRDPDGLYLLKGGGPKVWGLFRIKRKFREGQGIVHGKRCGTSQKLGPNARCHENSEAGPINGRKIPVPRDRQRATLEGGLKLDLNKLMRARLLRPGCRFDFPAELEQYLHRRTNCDSPDQRQHGPAGRLVQNSAWKQRANRGFGLSAPSFRGASVVL